MESPLHDFPKSRCHDFVLFCYSVDAFSDVAKGFVDGCSISTGNEVVKSTLVDKATAAEQLELVGRRLHLE